MTKYHLTPKGLKKLKTELEYLKTIKRREISEQLERCISFGDLAENSEYQEAKEAQAFLEGRILELEDLINNAVVVSEKDSQGLAGVGSTILVTSVFGKEQFQIVGAEEADPLRGKISDQSPIGKALLNQVEGAIVVVNTPQGKTEYKILKIE